MIEGLHFSEFLPGAQTPDRGPFRKIECAGQEADLGRRIPREDVEREAAIPQASERLDRTGPQRITEGECGNYRAIFP